MAKGAQVTSGEELATSLEPVLVIYNANMLISYRASGGWQNIIELHFSGVIHCVTVLPALVEAIRHVDRMAGPEEAKETYYNFFGDDQQGRPRSIERYGYCTELEERALELLDGAAHSDYRVVAAVLGIKSPGPKYFVSMDKTLVKVLNKSAQELRARNNLIVLDPRDLVKIL